MELDIMILTSSSLQKSPFVFISGDMQNNKDSTNGPPILLGNYTNIHYQSLVEDNKALQQNVKPKLLENKQNEDQNENQDLTLKYSKEQLIQIKQTVVQECHLSKLKKRLGLSSQLKALILWTLQ